MHKAAWATAGEWLVFCGRDSLALWSRSQDLMDRHVCLGWGNRTLETRGRFKTW